MVLTTGKGKTPLPVYNGIPPYPICVPSSMETITAGVANGTDSYSDWVIGIIASGLNTEEWVFPLFKVLRTGAQMVGLDYFRV